MTQRSVSSSEEERFVAEMARQMTELAQRVYRWVRAHDRTLEAIEAEIRPLISELGAGVLAGLCQVQAPTYPPDTVECPCGHHAHYQRQRAARVKTLLGPVQVERPYYLCATCHHGQTPLDQVLQICAGSISAGLEEVLALLGTLVPYDQAVFVLEKLTRLSVSPTIVKAATDRVGHLVATHEDTAITAAWAIDTPQIPPLPETIPERLYLSMDGTMVHLHEEGWKEMRTGAVYTTTARPSRVRPDTLEVRAKNLSFYVDLTDADRFGQGFWVEAARRGATAANEVVIIGDGAHWIWAFAAEHFPRARQIVDWYHASEYVWSAAHALRGETTASATAWAEARLTELWNGDVETIIAQCTTRVTEGEEVQKALTYLTHNQERMRYADYRAQGLQIGSGSIESSCKHLIGARLKQAGMIWTRASARAVAKARARLKSGRWDATVAARPPLQRSYTRKAA